MTMRSLSIGVLCAIWCLASASIELNLAALGNVAELYINGESVDVQMRSSSMSPYMAQTYELDSMPDSVAVKITNSNFLGALLLADLKENGRVVMTSGNDQWRCTTNVNSDQWMKPDHVQYDKFAMEFGQNKRGDGQVKEIYRKAVWISSEVGTAMTFCEYIAAKSSQKTLEGLVNKLIEDLQGELTDPLKMLLNNRLDNDLLADGLLIPRHLKKPIKPDLEDRLNDAMLVAMDKLRGERVGPVEADDVFPKPKFGSKTCMWPDYACSQSKYRSFDGSCNNLNNPLFGRAGIPYVRVLDSNYDNDVDSLRTKGVKKALPGSRQLSLKVSLHKTDQHPLKTQAVMGFGQFLDHDFNLTPQETTYIDDDGIMRAVDCGHDGCDDSNPACSPIPVPKKDPSFHQDCLKFFRSVGTQDLKCSSGKREQMNAVTAFIDGSQIYGSNLAIAMSLRDQSDPSRGRLNVTHHPFDASSKDLLPQSTTGCALDGEYKCFAAGDVRVNEHHGLSIFHTLGHREHNRIEEILHELNPHWDGDKLYQEARQIVWAQLQVIAFKEFLPAILSSEIMSEYDLELQDDGHYGGYEDNLDPSMANHFATATFRYGHSTVANEMETLSSSWDRLNFYKLRDQFFVPKFLYNTDQGGIDGFMRGIVDQRSERCDRHLPVEMTDHLLLWDAKSQSRERTDLFSLNTRRGRDHGLPGYNAYREHCGLAKLTKFDKPDVFQEKSTSKVFKKQYNSVDDIDIFAGGISETPLKGGMIGETFACLLGEQFEKLRKGDRFWHENPAVFTGEQLQEIRKTSLGKIFCENSDHIQIMQPNVMEVPFREAFPQNDFSLYDMDDHGLSKAEFNERWTNDFNARVPCNELPAINLAKWQENMMY